MDNDRLTVKEVKGMQNQGRRETLSYMRERISFCMVVVVLMVVVGVVVLMLVLGVMCLGVVEVECSEWFVVWWKVTCMSWMGVCWWWWWKWM